MNIVCLWEPDRGKSIEWKIDKEIPYGMKRIKERGPKSRNEKLRIFSREVGMYYRYYELQKKHYAKVNGNDREKWTANDAEMGN